MLLGSVDPHITYVRGNTDPFKPIQCQFDIAISVPGVSVHPLVQMMSQVTRDSEKKRIYIYLNNIDCMRNLVQGSPVESDRLKFSTGKDYCRKHLKITVLLPYLTCLHAVTVLEQYKHHKGLILMLMSVQPWRNCPRVDIIIRCVKLDL